MNYYNHSLSIDAAIMVSKKLLVLFLPFINIFTTYQCLLDKEAQGRQLGFLQYDLLKTTLIVALRVYNSKTAR